MDKLYRISYFVTTEKAYCKIYTYPIVSETKTYYKIQLESCRKQIQKEMINKIHHVDQDRTIYAVYVTDLSNQDELIKEMAEKVKESTLRKMKKYQAIHDHTAFIAQCVKKIPSIIEKD